jgi:hypothetical protein
MIKKLKACPFCGGNASVLTLGNEAKVVCDVCIASSNLARGERAKETAIRLWNTRSYAECELAVTASFAFVAGIFDDEKMREHLKHEIITAIKSGELKAEGEEE